MTARPAAAQPGKWNNGGLVGLLILAGAARSRNRFYTPPPRDSMISNKFVMKIVEFCSRQLLVFRIPVSLLREYDKLVLIPYRIPS
jgi:hypothetical protein